MSLNRVVLVGRLVRDPESRTTNTGKGVVEFSIAVTKQIKPTDPNQPDADFFRVSAWNQTADYVSQYGAKGRLVAVDGRLQSRKYVDKDGNNREVIEVVADNVNLLDRAPDASGDGSQARDDRQPAGAARGAQSQGARPAGPGGRTPQGGYSSRAPSADEYDPFADE